MISEENIKLARKKLKRGEPDGEIRNALQEEGYSKEDIDKVFVPHKPDMRSWYLFFAVVFLLAGIYTVIAYSNAKLLLLSGSMFFAYFWEVNKIKKQASDK